MPMCSRPCAYAALLLALAGHAHALPVDVQQQREHAAESTVDEDILPSRIVAAAAAKGEQVDAPRGVDALTVDQDTAGEERHSHKIFDVLQRHVMAYSPAFDMIVDEPVAHDKNQQTRTTMRPAAALQSEVASRPDEARSPHLKIMPDFEYGLKGIEVDALQRAAHRGWLRPEAKPEATSRQAADDELEGAAPAAQARPTAEKPRARTTEVPQPRRLTRPRQADTPKLRRRVIEAYDE